MALPPLWKIRREIWRGIGKIRFAIMARTSPKSTIRYRGLDVPLNRAGMNSEIVYALARNSYEDPEIRGLQRAASDGDRILELGSGMGIVTALAGQACAPKGQVLSFEANASMIPDSEIFLTKHAITNVEIRNAVLVPSAAEGETREFHLTGSFASSSLLDTQNRKSNGTISVPAQTLNSVVAKFQPTVLVCDIEGGEAELIPALDASNLRAVVIEMHPDRLSQDQLDAVTSALERQGLSQSSVTLGGTVLLFERAAT